MVNKGRAVGLRQAARQLGEVPCIQSTHIAEERIHAAALHEAIIEAPDEDERTDKEDDEEEDVGDEEAIRDDEEYLGYLIHKCGYILFVFK